MKSIAMLEIFAVRHEKRLAESRPSPVGDGCRRGRTIVMD